MTVMSRLEYLAELNRRLMDHADYEPGMEFVFAPPGATADEAHGFYWLPAEAEEPMRSIALDAATQITVPQAAPGDRPTAGLPPARLTANEAGPNIP